MCSRVVVQKLVQNSNIQNCLVNSVTQLSSSAPLLEISIDGCKIWPLAGKIAKKRLSWLEISIYGCRIWPFAGKIIQKSLNVGSGLKIDGCMYLLPHIDGCSCTRGIRNNKGPIIIGNRYLVFSLGHLSTRSIKYLMK